MSGTCIFIIKEIQALRVQRSGLKIIDMILTSKSLYFYKGTLFKSLPSLMRKHAKN